MNLPLDRWRTVGALPYRLSADEFWRMVEVGVFDDNRIDLVEGELVEMAPSNTRHGMLAAKVLIKLGQAYNEEDWLLLLDVYVTIARSTVRAADIVVIRRHEDVANRVDAAEVHLAVEISHSSLNEDLNRKKLHYAKANIPNYWVFDVEARKVHRFSAPRDSEYAESAVDSFSDPLPLPGIDATLTIG